MADRMTPEQRRKCMSHIRGKDTKPELVVRRFLHAHGYRFRLHVCRLPGTPDIVLRRLRTVILVNGCFWHGHGVAFGEGSKVQGVSKVQEVSGVLEIADSACCKIPRSNRAFWVGKIARNQARDLEVRHELTAMGWNVISLWECELRGKAAAMTLQRLLMTLNGIEIKEMKNEKLKMKNGGSVNREQLTVNNGGVVRESAVNSEQLTVNNGWVVLEEDYEGSGRMVADDSGPVKS